VTVAYIESLAPAMQLAENSNRDLGRPEVLRAAGAWLARLCREADCSVVVAASRSAEWIVASAVLSDGELVPASADARSRRVMIVEGAVVTGSALHHAARLARSEGATWVGAAVLQRTRPDLDQIESVGFDLIRDLWDGHASLMAQSAAAAAST